MHWHCINSNANLYIIDLFLNEYANTYIGLNGSITYGTNSENDILFEDRLIRRSSFLSKRFILETDYSYLVPRNIHGTYDPSCALPDTATYLSKKLNDHNQSPLSYVHSSNKNIISIYDLKPFKRIPFIRLLA